MRLNQPGRGRTEPRPTLAPARSGSEAVSRRLGRTALKLAATAFLLAGGLISGGCVVSDEEFEAASRERDLNLNDSQAMVNENDRLNREIARIYNDCDVLASQLAMISATSLHNRLTADIGRPQPEPPAARPAPAPERTRQAAEPGGGNSGRRTESGARTSDAGGNQNQGSGGGSSTPPGGSSAPPPSGGSVDWGSLTSF